MTFNKLLARFKPNQANTSPIVVIMQSDGVFLSEKGQQEVSNCDVRANNWQKSLAQQLSSYPQKGRQVQVIIGSHWYHTYQIETPRIPKSEWPQALPFLLKDVISERVTEIVADGLELPSLNKTTAYVVQKAWLLQLRTIVEESGHELSQVVPEELVWAQGKQDAESYVLLQRSRFHHYRVSAFSQGLPLFHRTIRTVSGPVIQGDNLGLDVDSLALELQRSLDYLSSQLKTGAVHKLLCCCDEESEQQLSLALSERLSVNVVPLVEEREGWTGELLARIAVQAQTFAINLYPEYLKPKQEHLSLNRVAALWGVTTVCLLMVSGYSSYVMKQKVAVIEQLELQSESLHQQLSEKQAALEAHRPSPVKAAAIARLKQEIEAKQDALKAVDDYDQKQQLGYSGVMNALATLGRNDISIQNIYLDQDNIDISGLARSASAVPNWVGQFKQEQSLVGRTFKTLKIGRNANDIVTFELRTRPELASLKSLVNNGETVTASQVKEARQ
ncbi:MSHA biogenesis protein MshI [Vibrio hangzhouensis]|uniref:MSHA biogenesis protein MshI n=1 Tax=Vibrio hangzhouensis TaxID=462991 RepID=UPI001C96D86C|nr:MSHA biogenesis protein MshI [Vibrio hangzhouensis]MBY6197064.1 MSHA biogenesis protein MshI [Vibrio hangzhouensis]